MYKYFVVLLILSLIGIVDASFLTYEHFSKRIPPCSVDIFADCGKVLASSYSTFFGIPIAIFGVIFYTIVLVFSWKLIVTTDVWIPRLLLVTGVGAGFSIYFVYLQLVVIKAICLYCMVSAVNSIVLCITCLWMFKKYRSNDKPYLSSISLEK